MITFSDDYTLYSLKVSDNCVLEASETKEEASPFFLVKCNDTFEEEFYIVYYGQILNERKGRFVAPSTAVSIPHYLEASPSFLGNHDGPLSFKPNTDFKASEYKFKFEELLNEKNSVHQIMEQEKPFYIRCPRNWKTASYLSFTKTESTGWRFCSGCTGSKERHNQTTCSMLFRLQAFKPEESPPTLPQLANGYEETDRVPKQVFTGTTFPNSSFTSTPESSGTSTPESSGTSTPEPSFTTTPFIAQEKHTTNSPIQLNMAPYLNKAYVNID